MIDQNKEMLGVVSTTEALRLARDAGMDLVEISPNERPPVCRIMDFGKHKYDTAKKSKQRHHEQKIKEVRLRPKTDEHDRTIKMNRARGFIKDGDRVQFTMLFRGRERFRHDLGLQAFNDIIKMLEDVAKVDRYPKAMGRRMTMVLAPLKPGESSGKPKPKKPPKDKSKSQPTDAPKSEQKPETAPTGEVAKLAPTPDAKPASASAPSAGNLPPKPAPAEPTSAPATQPDSASPAAD